jgi:hypothetical protein
MTSSEPDAARSFRSAFRWAASLTDADHLPLDFGIPDDVTPEMLDNPLLTRGMGTIGRMLLDQIVALRLPLFVDDVHVVALTASVVATAYTAVKRTCQPPGMDQILPSGPVVVEWTSAMLGGTICLVAQPGAGEDGALSIRVALVDPRFLGRPDGSWLRHEVHWYDVSVNDSVDGAPKFLAITSLS